MGWGVCALLCRLNNLSKKQTNHCTLLPTVSMAPFTLQAKSRGLSGSPGPLEGRPPIRHSSPVRVHCTQCPSPWGARPPGVSVPLGAPEPHILSALVLGCALRLSWGPSFRPSIFSANLSRLTASTQVQMAALAPVTPSSQAVGSESHFHLAKGCGRSRGQAPHAHPRCPRRLTLKTQVHWGVGGQGQPGSLVWPAMPSALLTGCPRNSLRDRAESSEGPQLSGPSLSTSCPAQGYTAWTLREVPCSAEGPEVGPSAGSPALPLHLWSPPGNLSTVPKRPQPSQVSWCRSADLLGRHRTSFRLISPQALHPQGCIRARLPLPPLDSEPSVGRRDGVPVKDPSPCWPHPPTLHCTS